MTSIPRILFGVPLVVAGVMLPAFGAAPAKAPIGTLGMGHEGFAVKVVKVRIGDTITLVNDSRFVHIIGAGRNGLLQDDSAVPMPRRKMLETNSVYTTGKWTKPGVYYVTCSVHPEMTVKVIVTATVTTTASGAMSGCGCCTGGSCV